MYNLFCITQRRKMNILKYLIYIIHVSVYISAVIDKYINIKHTYVYVNIHVYRKMQDIHSLQKWQLCNCC